MPQHVRGQGHSESGPASIRGKNLPDAHAAQLAAPPVEKQRRAARRLADEVRPRFAKILFHYAERLASHGNNALFVAFADTAQTTDLGIEIRDSQPNEFRDPQARRIQNLQHRAIPQSNRGLRIGLRQQALDFFQPQISGQRPPDFRRFEVARGIYGNQFVDLREAKEVAQRYQMPRDGLAFQLLPVQRRQKIHQVIAADGLQAQFALLGEGIEFY